MIFYQKSCVLNNAEIFAEHYKRFFSWKKSTHCFFLNQCYFGQKCTSHKIFFPELFLKEQSCHILRKKTLLKQIYPMIQVTFLYKWLICNYCNQEKTFVLACIMSVVLWYFVVTVNKYNYLKKYQSNSAVSNEIFSKYYQH